MSESPSECASTIKTFKWQTVASNTCDYKRERVCPFFRFRLRQWRTAFTERGLEKVKACFTPRRAAESLISADIFILLLLLFSSSQPFPSHFHRRAEASSV